MAQYEYIVTDLDGEVLGNLPLASVVLSEDLNRPVTLTAQIGLRHPKATRTLIDPLLRKVWAVRDGVTVFGGLLWAADPDTASDRLGLKCADDLAYFYARTIRSDRVFTNQDQVQIAYALLVVAQLEPSGNIGLTVPAITPTGVLRDRTYYGYELANVGVCLENLASVENGFDYSVLPGGSVETGFTQTWQTHYPQRGVETGNRWTLREPVAAGSTLIAGLSGSDSGEQSVNRMDAVGAGEGLTMLRATATDTASLAAGYPLLDGVTTYKDVSVAATLAAHAREDLRVRVKPPRTYKATLRPDHPDTQPTSFSVGDRVSLDAKWGYLDIDGSGRWRVINRTIRVLDNTGDDRVEVVLQEVLL
jgi:hypothetical protein